MGTLGMMCKGSFVTFQSAGSIIWPIEDEETSHVYEVVSTRRVEL